MVIDHRRGRAESGFDRSLHQQVRDYSDQFQEYEGILINNDRSFYTTQDSLNRPQNPGVRPGNGNEAVVIGDKSQIEFNDVPAYRSPEAIRAEAGGSVVQQLTEHQLLLLCPDALGYGLRRKRWSRLIPLFPILLQ